MTLPRAERTLSEAQLAELKALQILRGVPDSELHLLAGLLSTRAIEEGTTITLEGSAGPLCFFLTRGVLALSVRNHLRRETLISTLGRGDCIGEWAIFGHNGTQLIARAASTCSLLQLSADALRAVLPNAPTLRNALQHYYRQQRINTTLSLVPLFGPLSPAVRLALARHMQRVDAARGTTIVTEGEPASDFYIVEQGQLAVEQQGALIATLSDGEFFGEMSLITAREHNATVRTLTPSHLLMLPGTDFQRLIQEHPSLQRALDEIIDSRIRNAAKLITDQQRAAELSQIVHHGLLRGTRLLVRQPELCPPGCRICEDACAARFGQQRIFLNGLLLHGFDFLNGCRQCQIGAECVEACPENALEWTNNDTLIVNDHCTGCGACVEACPYAAVQLKQHSNAPRHSLLLELAMRKLRRQQEPELIPLIANKCDFCHGHADMACIKACPTGSLQLIDPEQLHELGLTGI